MYQRIYYYFKMWLVWLALVAFFFFILLSQFGDYRARAQMSQALSLVSSAKATIYDSYEANQYCSKGNTEVKNFSKQGKYVSDVLFTHVKGSDACYVIVEMASTPQIDKRVRGSKLMLVAELPSPWIAQVNCITDIKQTVADCQFSQWGDLWMD